MAVALDGTKLVVTEMVREGEAAETIRSYTDLYNDTLQTMTWMENQGVVGDISR